MVPKGYAPLVVRHRHTITDDLAVFYFDYDGIEAPSFIPGQYVTLGVDKGGPRPILRAYSIVSAPHEDGLELFIECVPDGELTPSLFELAVGDSLLARQKIVGHFVLDESVTRHVMAATVTGIAPFCSMVRAHRHARATGQDVPDHQFLILHGASESVEIGPYLPELTELAREGWVHYVPTVSRPWNDPDWRGETGRVEDTLRKHMDALGWDPAEVAGYACGNPQMIETVKGMFKRARLPQERIHDEKYFTTKEEKPARAPVAQPAADGALKRTPKLPPGVTKRVPTMPPGFVAKPKRPPTLPPAS